MYITIKDKKIIWEVKDWTYKYIEAWSSRTLAQNRLYFAYLADLKDAFNEKGIFITINELHEGLSQKLLKWHYNKNKVTWKRTITRKSTKDLSKKAFSKYIEDIEKYIYREFEITIPLRTDIFYNQ